MLTYTVPARRDPTAALATLRHVAMQAPVFTSARGEVRDAAASLLELVERMPPFNHEERHATIAS